MKDKRDKVMEQVHDLFVYASEKEREDITNFIEEVLAGDQTMRGYLEIFNNDAVGCRHKPFKNWLAEKYKISSKTHDEYEDSTMLVASVLPKLTKAQIEVNEMIENLDKEVLFDG